MYDVKKYKHEWYMKNRDKLKKRRVVLMEDKNRKTKHKLYMKSYYLKNKNKLLNNTKVWVENNRDRSNNIKDRWTKNNKDKVKLIRYSANKRRRLTRFGILNMNMSIAIRRSLKGNKNGSKWETILGYNLFDLVSHIESLFTPGMNWNNYGKNGWEVDHIQPISSFSFNNFSDDNFKRCWSFRNLQPLWQKSKIFNGVKYEGNTNKSNRFLGKCIRRKQCTNQILN